MRKILLKNTRLNGAETDVLITGTRFEKIAPGQIAEPETEIVDLRERQFCRRFTTRIRTPR